MGKWHEISKENAHFRRKERYLILNKKLSTMKKHFRQWQYSFANMICYKDKNRKAARFFSLKMKRKVIDGWEEYQNQN